MPPNDNECFPLPRQPLLGRRVTQEDEITWVLSTCHLLGWRYTEASARIEELQKVIQQNLLHGIANLIPYHTALRYMRRGDIPNGHATSDKISCSTLAQVIALEYQLVREARFDSELDVGAEQRLFLYLRFHAEWPEYLLKKQSIRRALSN